MKNAVEVEIDTPNNNALYFRPLQRAVRGRFDLMRVGEPMAKVKAQEWPSPVPSQRLGINADGTGYIREPLHDEENTALREKIEEQLGLKLEPEWQEFDSIHLPSWFYWLQRAVDSGIAKVVSGKLPTKIEGKPRKNFVTNDPPEHSQSERLATAIEQQTAVMSKLLEKLGEKA